MRRRFDQGGDIGWKMFGTPERALDALDLESAGGELASGFTAAFTVGERAAGG